MNTQQSTTTSPNQVAPRRFWLTFKALFTEPRLWQIFVLGVASGFPWLIHGSCLTLFLVEFGISKSTIGWFSLVGISYAINFLFGPFVDHLKIPLLSRLGQRRSWLLVCLIVMMASVMSMAYIMWSLGVPEDGQTTTAPLELFQLLAVFSAVLAFASAILDLSTAAFRITVIREDEPHLVGLAASMEASGWFAGFSFPGILAIGGTEWFGWTWIGVFFGLASSFLLFMLFVLYVIKEPPRPEIAPTIHRGFDKFFEEIIGQRLLGPVIEFIKRNGILVAFFIIVFLFSFKLGESFLGRMSLPFYKEVGYENDDIAIYSKFISPVVVIFSSIACGLFIGKFKTVPMLVVGGVAMSATNLMYSWIAVAASKNPDPSLTLYLWTAVLDGFTQGFSAVAFVAFITEFTSRLHAATQYATMASLGTLGRTVVAASSGVLIEKILKNNWILFFILTAVWIIPVLFILVVLMNFVNQRETRPGGERIRTVRE